MRITESALRRVIRNEIKSVMKEYNYSMNPYEDDDHNQQYGVEELANQVFSDMLESGRGNINALLGMLKDAAVNGKSQILEDIIEETMGEMNMSRPHPEYDMSHDPAPVIDRLNDLANDWIEKNNPELWDAMGEEGWTAFKG